MRDVCYSFLYGEKYTFQYVPFEKIEVDAPDYPGLYSWHIRILPGSEHKIRSFLSDVYVDFCLSAEVSGNLRQNYSGDLYRNKITASDAIISELLSNAILMINSPLYIGISRNLNLRLTTHKKQLNKMIKNKKKYILTKEYAIDSDEESNTFANRLGKFWNDRSFSITNCLYVKYFCYPVNEVIKTAKQREDAFIELQKLEYYLNSVFNPVFGRK